MLTISHSHVPLLPATTITLPVAYWCYTATYRWHLFKHLSLHYVILFFCLHLLCLVLHLQTCNIYFLHWQDAWKIPHSQHAVTAWLHADPAPLCGFSVLLSAWSAERIICASIHKVTGLSEVINAISRDANSVPKSATRFFVAIWVTCMNRSDPRSYIKIYKI